MPDTLPQCIEREREATDALKMALILTQATHGLRENIHAARAATDEAVRAVEAEKVEFMAALAHIGIEPCDDDGRENRTWIVPAEPSPIVCDTLAEALEVSVSLDDEATPAPTAQGESATPSDAPKCDVCGVPVEPTTSGFWEGRKMTWHCAVHALPTFPAQGGEVDSAYYDEVLARLMDARQRALGSPTVAVPWDDSAGIVALLLRTAQGESTGGEGDE